MSYGTNAGGISEKVGDGESQAIGMAELNAGFEAGASLAEGDRVRMSPRGRARHPKYGQREGVLVGKGSPSSWRVKFDERKSIQGIHQDYLERVQFCCTTDIATRASAPVTKTRVRSILQGPHDSTAGTASGSS